MKWSEVVYLQEIVVDSMVSVQENILHFGHFALTALLFLSVMYGDIKIEIFGK